ncbi:hypothetical protein Curi_c15110 [Gottschalkia acidurici 9a]|uniref:Uncharacterized protein n=1 Tax=Gottschalkia acidurici (strain ATCC 7906 / DSM 604 / BCRC 14475 / CIP 104303 / KCTC 5404 / NCIMB 10678 / 9a) TaxID=1128398 RepID=K0B0S8_GOTA9|nr:hypothetical protein [Gottschalkia acidurici]AFS78520.1 hypothetical protein Curi_c15110 [Gottschalkia acidurici 9a]
MNKLQSKNNDVDNTLAWTLAFLPIMIMILCLIYILIFDTNSISGKLLRFSIISINLSLCILDERKLKKLGYDTENLLLWILCFTPAYLFEREDILDQKRSYSIIHIIGWMVLIITSIIFFP